MIKYNCNTVLQLHRSMIPTNALAWHHRLCIIRPKHRSRPVLRSGTWLAFLFRKDELIKKKLQQILKIKLNKKNLEIDGKKKTHGERAVDKFEWWQETFNFQSRWIENVQLVLFIHALRDQTLGLGVKLCQLFNPCRPKLRNSATI